MKRKIFKNKYYPFDKSSIKSKLEFLSDDFEDEDDDEEEFYMGYRENFDREFLYEDY